MTHEEHIENMKPLRFLSLVSLVALVSCGGIHSTHPFASEGKPTMLKGTYMAGSNVTEPRPQKSRFLQTDNAGIVLLKGGAAYYLQARVMNSPAKGFYYRAEFENPRDKTRPFFIDGEVSGQADGLLLSSPDLVWGFRSYADYTIRVMVYENRSSSTPIDTLVQKVRCYADTTTGEVRVFEGMKPR
jgi:hypothetical protein